MITGMPLSTARSIVGLSASALLQEMPMPSQPLLTTSSSSWTCCWALASAGPTHWNVTPPSSWARVSPPVLATSNTGLIRPDVPGTPSSEVLLYAIGNASVIPYIVTTRAAYRRSMARYMSAAIGAAEMNRSGTSASRVSAG